MSAALPPDQTERRTAQLAARVLLDAWEQATATYWNRRAEQLEAARPRRGDYTGRATPTDLTAAYERLSAAADACRARATGSDGHTVAALADTTEALTPPTDDDLLDRLGSRLRAAFDAEDIDEAARLSDLIDALDGWPGPGPLTQAVNAA